MGNVTRCNCGEYCHNLCAKFNDDRLWNGNVLVHWECDNNKNPNNNNNDNVGSAWGSVSGSKKDHGLVFVSLKNFGLELVGAVLWLVANGSSTMASSNNVCPDNCSNGRQPEITIYPFCAHPYCCFLGLPLEFDDVNHIWRYKCWSIYSLGSYTTISGCRSSSKSSGNTDSVWVIVVGVTFVVYFSVDFFVNPKHNRCARCV